MPKGVLLVFSSPVDEEHDAEFNQWYDDVHLPETLSLLPGIVSAHRYRVLGGFGGRKHRYVTIYDVDSDAPEDILPMSGELAANGSMTLTDVIGDDPPIMATMCIALTEDDAR